MKGKYRNRKAKEVLYDFLKCFDKTVVSSFEFYMSGDPVLMLNGCVWVKYDAKAKVFRVLRRGSNFRDFTDNQLAHIYAGVLLKRQKKLQAQKQLEEYQLEWMLSDE